MGAQEFDDQLTHTRIVSVSGGSRTFTTGEAAKICKVSQQTIIRAFDAGQIGGFVIPLSTHRRITLRGLKDFVSAHGLVVDEWELRRTFLALADIGDTLSGTCDGPGAASSEVHTVEEQVRIALQGVVEPVAVFLTDDAFEAGKITHAQQPELVVLESGACDAVGIADNLKKLETSNRTLLIPELRIVEHLEAIPFLQQLFRERLEYAV